MVYAEIRFEDAEDRLLQYHFLRQNGHYHEAASYVLGLAHVVHAFCCRA